MSPITITYSDKDLWIIHQGNLLSPPMSWDEMLGTVALFTSGQVQHRKPWLYGMKTKEEYETIDAEYQARIAERAKGGEGVKPIPTIGTRVGKQAFPRSHRQQRAYSPENCRWALPMVQNRNRRNNRRLTVNGETRCVVEWAEAVGVRPDFIHCRLSHGWSEEDAVLKPAYNRGNMQQPDSERKNLPSASGIERIMLCPGSWQLEQQCPALPPGEDAVQGTLIHEALAKNDPAGLSDEQTETFMKCLALEAELLQKTFPGEEAHQIVETEGKL